MTTKTEALDRLADALAGKDVDTGSTIAGAIDKLAQMVEDGEISIGGGGGARTVFKIVYVDGEPTFDAASAAILDGMMAGIEDIIASVKAGTFDPSNYAVAADNGDNLAGYYRFVGADAYDIEDFGKGVQLSMVQSDDSGSSTLGALNIGAEEVHVTVYGTDFYYPS